MTEQNFQPQKPEFEEDYQPQNHDSDDLKFLSQLKSIQNLVTIATIAGPVSLLIGGVLLGAIAIICAAIAIAKMKKLQFRNQAQAELAGKVKRSAFIALGISIAAVAVNAIFVAMVMPEVMTALETGDTSGLLGSGAETPSSSNPSSVWG